MKNTYKIILIYCAIILLPNFSFAYNGPTTHAGITEQVVEFYNLSNSSKLSSADKEFLIQGSIDEDDPAIRALNHFYDPMRGMGINNYQNAIDWAVGKNKGNEFSWLESIAKYAKGDREGALIGLGHILHLAEDMTVPDHTRNDAHIGSGAKGFGTGDSVYEMWAKKYKDRETLKGIAQNYKRQGLLSRKNASIAGYFENISAYSNNNYVSADTIDSAIYQNPLVKEKRNGYAYGDDSYFYDRHKLYIEYNSRSGERFVDLIDREVKDYSVLEDYFPRLVKMAILSGAGITELFFTEAEEARVKYLADEKKKQEEGFVSKVVNTVSRFNNFLTGSIYNGTSLAINNIKNTVKGVSYTSKELASIGAKKIEQGAEIAQKVIVSSGQKVILYVKENSSNLSNSIGAAVTYNLQSKVAQASTLQLNQGEVSRLIAILEKTNSINSEISNDKAVQNLESPKKKNNGGGGHSDPVPDPIIDTIATSTATTTDPVASSTDPIATTTDPIITATSTQIYEQVSPPTVLSAINITNTSPTTTILFSGTSSVDFIISNDFDSISTSTDMEGNWSLNLENIPQGTTTINFYAEPDLVHSSSTIIDSITGFATTTYYTKSSATESAVFVESDEVPDISVAEPEICQTSFLADRCLVKTPEILMSWNSNSANLDHYSVIINDGETVEYTATSSILILDDYTENKIEIFAVNDKGDESDHIIYEVIVYTNIVIINEIAWMGTVASAYDEWMELYNVTPYDIDLSNWSLRSADNGINISLENQIGGEGYYLLERTDDTTVSNIPADQIYTGDLKNTGDVLTLYFASSTIDRTPNTPGRWAEGKNAPQKNTMERRNSILPGEDPESWQTNKSLENNGFDSANVSIDGTPRIKNNDEDNFLM